MVGAGPVDGDLEPVLVVARAVDGDAVEVVGRAGDPVDVEPRRTGREREVAVVDVAVAVDQVDRAVEARSTRRRAPAPGAGTPRCRSAVGV